jgi:hypothetical protein
MFYSPYGHFGYFRTFRARKVVGDLTTTLRLKQGCRSFPALPGVRFTRDYLLDQYVNSQDQPNPVVPAKQTLPTQEPGSRPHTP